MEALVIATPMQLPNNHPAYQLTSPGFNLSIAINNGANSIFLAELPGIKDLTVPTIETSLNLMNKAY